MSGLKMPGKGKAALLLSELNAEHAPQPGAENDTTIEGIHVTTLQGTNDATYERKNELVNTETNLASNDTTNVAARAPKDGPAKNRAAGRSKAATAAVQSERDDRLAKALQLAAEDEIAVVTVRVSARLNKYMDQYVERLNRISPKRKYRKQDAVAEAFAAFFADHLMPPAPVDEEL